MLAYYHATTSTTYTGTVHMHTVVECGVTYPHQSRCYVNNDFRSPTSDQQTMQHFISTWLLSEVVNRVAHPVSGILQKHCRKVFCVDKYIPLQAPLHCEITKWHRMYPPILLRRRQLLSHCLELFCVLYILVFRARNAASNSIEVVDVVGSLFQRPCSSCASVASVDSTATQPSQAAFCLT